MRSSRIEDWIPGLSCDDVYHPRTWSGPDTVAVWTFRPGAAADASQVGVTGAGSEVYSSTDRLYVTSTDWGSRPILRGGPDTTTRSDQLDRVLRPKTYIHAFALDGDSTRYVASGAVNGTIKDGWSLDEQDGHLRVAVSWLTNGLEPRDNGIAVLDEHGGTLEQVGALHALGIGEQVQSVRWFDDLAVLVTFRQTDPLYTIDLSDPTHPRLLGALKIPGFSSYLHPIGDDRLLGIGSDATETGQQLGAQAAVFDIADRSDVRQVGKVTFGMNSWLEAADDPHAFTWLPAVHAAVTSVAGRIARVDGAAARRSRRITERARARLGRRLGSPSAPARGRPGGAGRRPGADRRPALRPAIVAALRRGGEDAGRGLAHARS